eukprot:TRINITY_DN74259_c0_g1_i1.p1 TRINITY_DN74259_c0_g1~~TRINITY_DN74259_c0_g1_i1.p1  ORF type:complete len:502 (-),score=150.46 TRINITY_DN74259_c0_g1_i1:84-1589(-)
MNSFFANVAELVSVMWTEVVLMLLAAVLYMLLAARAPAPKPKMAKTGGTPGPAVQRTQPAEPAAHKTRPSPQMRKTAPQPVAASSANAAASKQRLAAVISMPPAAKERSVRQESFAAAKPAAVPGPSSYASRIKALAQKRDIPGLWRTWQEAKNQQPKVNAVVLGCMVDALVSNRRADDAWELVWELEESPEQRGVANTITYSTLLKGFAASKEANKVLAVYKEMKAKDIACNIITYNTILNAFAQCGDMHSASQIWAEMRAAEPRVEPDLVTYSTLVKGYASSGDLKRALEILSELKKDPTMVPDEVLYNSLLDGCARERRVKEATSLMEDMRKCGVTPSNYTVTIMVKLLGRSKMLNQAFALVDEVREKHGVKPNVQVYTCLITACFQCRQTKKGVALLDRMLDEGLQPDEKAYDVIIRGCRQAGQMALAEDIERRAAAGPAAVTRAVQKPTVVANAKEGAVLPPWRKHNSSTDSLCSTDCSSGSDSSGESEREVVVGA